MFSMKNAKCVVSDVPWYDVIIFGNLLLRKTIYNFFAMSEESRKPAITMIRPPQDN